MMRELGVNCNTACFVYYLNVNINVLLQISQNFHWTYVRSSVVRISLIERCPYFIAYTFLPPKFLQKISKFLQTASIDPPHTIHRLRLFSHHNFSVYAIRCMCMLEFVHKYFVLSTFIENITIESIYSHACMKYLQHYKIIML